jgi:hypothetical protein
VPPLKLSTIGRVQTKNNLLLPEDFNHINHLQLRQFCKRLAGIYFVSTFAYHTLTVT